MNVFAEPAGLYAGLLITAAVGLFLWWSECRKTRRLEKFAASKLLEGLTSNRSRAKVAANCILLTLAVLVLFMTLARPQWGTRQRKTAPTGIDVLIALDVSRSMLARDVKPNRIERVKLGITNLLDKVKGDRLGLIAFAGSSFLQCPLTLDHTAFRRTLREMEVGVIKRHGTDFALPIEEAMRSFSEKDNDRFLILISDGEDLEQQGLKKAKAAANEGVRIYTIGIGSKQGARIPLTQIGKPARNYLKDINGKVVVTAMDDANLRSIAEATGGKYYSLGPTGEGLAKVVNELQTIGQQKRHALLTEEFPIERFQTFLLLAVILLLVEFLLNDRRRTHAVGSGLALFLLFFLPGCMRKDNVKDAEEAHENKDYAKAAAFYEAELNATLAQNNQADPRLYLNIGLAHLEASNLDQAKIFLEQALDKTVDQPDLQSTILNALGNLHYAEANQSLDAQDVVAARKAWGLALQKYDAAMSIDDNPKAKENRENLSKQLDERIKALISRISGIVWRDVNGNGRFQNKEPRLAAKVFWDKDENGEHNASSEPFVQTDEQGRYGIEWISSAYPVTFHLGSVLTDENASAGFALVPILPPPPPPQNPDRVRSYFIQLPKATDRQAHFPYRAAPVLKGFVWKDEDQDGRRGEQETGFAGASLFLDENSNGKLEKNEISFKPSDKGLFAQVVSPGKHTLSIQIESENGIVTFPSSEPKTHLAFVDFETSAEHLDFGVYAPDDQGQDTSQNQPNPESNQEKNDNKPPPENQDENEADETTAQNETKAPQEVNALYERLLQEIEASAETLDLEGKVIEGPLKGRDY